MSLIHLSAPPSDMNTKAASQRPLASAQVSSTQTGLNVGERILAQVTSVRAASDHLGKAQVLEVSGQLNPATGGTSSPPLQAALQAQMTRTLLDALGRTLSASLEAATQNAKPTGTQTSSTQHLAGTQVPVSSQGHPSRSPNHTPTAHTPQQATNTINTPTATTKAWVTEFQLANGQKLTLALPKALPAGTQLQIQQANSQQIQLSQPRVQTPSTQVPLSTSNQRSTPPPQTTPSPQAGQPMGEALAKTPIQNGPSIPAQPIQTKNDPTTTNIQQTAQPQTGQVQTQPISTSTQQAPKTLAEALKAVSYHLRNSLPQQKPLLEVRQQLPQLQQNLLQAFRSQMPATQTSSGSTPNTAQTPANKASIASTQVQIPTSTTGKAPTLNTLSSTTNGKTPNAQAVMPTPTAPTPTKAPGLPAQVARIEQALTQVSQLLNRIPGSQGGAAQAQEVKTWVQQSGSFMEAQLARQQAPTGDLKAGLLELKQALQQGQQWAGQQAQQGQALNRVQTQALQQIQQWTEAGIARIQSTQVNSLQQTQASVAERGPSVQVVQMELPVIIRQQTETVGLMMETWQDAVDEEGHQGSEQRVRQRYWRMTLSFDLPTLGALHTQVYYHDQKLETEMWFEKTQGAAYVQPRLQELEQRLTALGLEVPPVRCRQGCPPQLQTPKHMQNLLDTRA